MSYRRRDRNGESLSRRVQQWREWWRDRYCTCHPHQVLLQYDTFHVAPFPDMDLLPVRCYARAVSHQKDNGSSCPEKCDGNSGTLLPLSSSTQENYFFK